MGCSGPRARAVFERHGWLLGAALLAVAMVAPFLFGTYGAYLCALGLVNVVIAVGLNLLTGNAGQISLCNSSFVAIGAYASTLISTRTGLSFWLSLPLVGAISAAFGALLALPAMRLRGFYLALATLGFLEITQVLIEEFADITGGIRGMLAPRPSLFGLPLDTDRQLYFAMLPVACLLVLVAWNLLHSATGRAFNAIRVSPEAAQTLGISPARTKLIAFALAACYAGVAGALGAAVVGFIDPAEFGAGAALRQVTFIVVGGLGSVAGSVIGAIALTLLPEMLRGVQEYADFVYAALLLLFLMALPHGLVGLPSMLRRRAP